MLVISGDPPAGNSDFVAVPAPPRGCRYCRHSAILAGPAPAAWLADCATAPKRDRPSNCRVAYLARCNRQYGACHNELAQTKQPVLAAQPPTHPAPAGASSPLVPAAVLGYR